MGRGGAQESSDASHMPATIYHCYVLRLPVWTVGLSAASQEDPRPSLPPRHPSQGDLLGESTAPEDQVGNSGQTAVPAGKPELEQKNTKVTDLQMYMSNLGCQVCIDTMAFCLLEVTLL